jgi:gamma-glutamylcyclotransferase (GGCT)/AIG2-like uncharacterized protein YtfP
MHLQYASYGSNLHPVRLRQRMPSAELLGTAELPGWTLHFHKRSNVDDSAKCSILPGDGSVRVAVYRIVAQDKQRLDRIEGLGNGYENRVVSVPGYGDCFTYVATASHIDDSLAPLDWYREIVALGCEYHGFPEAYTASIRSITAVPDADAERNRQEWALVEQLRSAE